MNSIVYFTRDFKKIRLLLDSLQNYIKGENIALKTHFGEKGNTTYLPPNYCQAVCKYLKNKKYKIKLIESNVLYKGERTYALSHVKLAKEHGYNFAPIDIYDEKDLNDCWRIKVHGKHFKKIKAVKNLKRYDFLVALSHFKGHMTAGFGGALKNVGMGLASRAGKLDMHAKMAPTIDPEKCVGCGICLENCPVKAITITNTKAKINSSMCIGCAKCLAVCLQEAPSAWISTPRQLQERIVEYSAGILKNIKAIFINCVVNITAYCDCHDSPDKILIKKIGFLASADPVAIDQASYDLVIKKKKNIKKLIPRYWPPHQLIYAEKMKLGSRKYKLIELK